MRRLGYAAAAASLVTTFVALAGPRATLAQQADIGVTPIVLHDEPYAFETAEQGFIRVEVVARGLSHPFSFAFLPNGDALIVERSRALRRVRNAAAGHGAPVLEPGPIAGIPDSGGVRNGGLHDIALHPHFATNGLLYFTYNRVDPPEPHAQSPTPGAVRVVLARARLEGDTLADVEDLLVGDQRTGASGSRIAFAADDLLFMTTGAPFDDNAQNLGSVYGKVLRLHDDGSIPPDNPFVDRPGARGEVFSLGHRDQLGLAVHPETGAVVAAEHGPQGGDKVNLILPGRNYGWPRYSFGRAYDGSTITAMPLGEETEPPLILWIPSVAPTGTVFYSGDRFPAWRGNLFVGSARRGQIPRTGGLERIVLNDNLEELRRESLLTQLHQRIRDVRQGPDGLLYVITDEEDGALLRISPHP